MWLESCCCCMSFFNSSISVFNSSSSPCNFCVSCSGSPTGVPCNTFNAHCESPVKLLARCGCLRFFLGISGESPWSCHTAVLWTCMYMCMIMVQFASVNDNSLLRCVFLRTPQTSVNNMNCSTWHSMCFAYSSEWHKWLQKLFVFRRTCAIVMQIADLAADWSKRNENVQFISHRCYLELHLKSGYGNASSGSLRHWAGLYFVLRHAS